MASQVLPLELTSILEGLNGLGEFVNAKGTVLWWSSLSICLQCWWLHGPAASLLIQLLSGSWL